ncbi:MAG: hypothetical protein D6728_07445 [Cyanobacteria bacterium J055]|nr:MAG: hypothetical protein D6728_07445 [Cyanobacteria bacterium J055]
MISLSIGFAPFQVLSRCVDGFFGSKSGARNCQKTDGVSVLADRDFSRTRIHTPREIAETRIRALRCVDPLSCKGLRGVVAKFAETIYTFWKRCVKSTLEIHTLSGLPDELPTDWVKSD